MIEDTQDSLFSDAHPLAKDVPHVVPLPGVYLMRDNTGTIIYVGKARNLRKRLQSYFQVNRPHDPKTSMLLSRAASFETITTHTEKEAFILESNLIKRHRPRYNVNLKDDKRYPSLRLNIAAPYPNLSIVRKPAKDGALYFGPYASAGAVRQTLKFINKTFKLCKCRCEPLKKRARPCLNYQMGLCMGPCFSEVDREAYKEAVHEVIAFLRGRTPALIRKIEKQMAAAAQTQNFERAAMLRDKMFALRQTLEKQVSVTTDFKDRDVVGIAVENELSVVTLLRVRGGFLLGSRHFVFENAMGSEPEQIDAFLRQYYTASPSIPREVIASHLPADKNLVEEVLSEQKGAKVTLAAPQRGDKEKLVRMALQNARQALEEQFRQKDSSLDLLQRLQKQLRLQRLPRRIECFDNSNLGATEPVAGMVVFENGLAQPSAFRRYKLKPSSKPDDYAYMAEVLRRRYEKEDALKPHPDLLLVDGGKGQLNVAMAILTDLNLTGAFDVAGIAKKNPYAGEHQDKIYLPARANPVQFSREQDLLLFLQRIRDEAHRFAVGFQRKRRQGRAMHSLLDGINGIGPKRKAQLLKHFGSLARIGSASLEELTSQPGISESLARSIKEALEVH
ncbi:MAG: excinuclease ABC subunit UvrC [Desulfobacteraceae bacterium]|nr:MAG: excinuclease ABC subunit UvrC [Desulfobacteraceae bacterium]